MAIEIHQLWVNLGKKLGPNDMERARERAKAFFDAVEKKDTNYLEGCLRPDSVISRRVFTEITGVNLGQLVKEMKTALKNWAK